MDSKPASGEGLAVPQFAAGPVPLGGTGLPMNGTTKCWPSVWPIDGRDGGVPDPTTAGPAIIQIGTEGGILPAPVVIPSTPVGYEYNRRNIVVLNISTHGLLLGPAERADVIVDFSGVPAGAKLILYNDSPAPVPANDTRLDYYTGDPDQTSTGGAPPTLPGYGPNTRTLMRFEVGSAPGSPTSVSLADLQAALPDAFRASQPTPIVPESAYSTVVGSALPDTYSRIGDTSLTYTPIGAAQGTPPTAFPMLPKAIQELFTLDYGRMNATLGVELPFTNFNNQTTIPLGYVDPITETLADGQQQIWKITHNGVDTHAIHFHLFNVQLINRVGWDGALRPPNANEVGWKDTVRMNPLEDAIVAIRPVSMALPFGIPNSVRLLDPTKLEGVNLTLTSPANGNAITVVNVLSDFGWEYVWHCHLLGHEENDMMRPMVVRLHRDGARRAVQPGGHAFWQQLRAHLDRPHAAGHLAGESWQRDRVQDRKAGRSRCVDADRDGAGERDHLHRRHGSRGPDLGVPRVDLQRGGELDDRVERRSRRRGRW